MSPYLLHVIPSENSLINDKVNSKLFLNGVLVTSSGVFGAQRQTDAINTVTVVFNFYHGCYGLFLQRRELLKFHLFQIPLAKAV